MITSNFSEYLELDTSAPYVVEVAYGDPAIVFSKFSDQEWSILLDSADASESSSATNRYSYIAIDPFKKMVLKDRRLYIDDKVVNTNDPFMIMQKNARQYKLTCYDELPPFQGGLVGLLSYDLCHAYEDLSKSESVSQELEDMAVGFYDTVHAFDHHCKKSWIISSGLPYNDQKVRAQHAKKRLLSYCDKLESQVAIGLGLSIKQETCQFRSNFTKKSYLEIVNKAIEYIKSGDIFEVNLSQRISCDIPKNFDHYNLYSKLKEINPSPFSAYFNIGKTKILSSSPERFIKVRDGEIETRPIKGTRKRGKSEAEDKELAYDLLRSEKDRAENIMIVDLMRNDLSRVCLADSINVPQLCGLETFPHVHHLVSVIKGRLAPEYDCYDLLKASFPGGSITGAPKIRAMQIISELEPDQRGPYCGSMFFVNFDGSTMDSSILIRTYVIRNQVISFHGGGAVTINSNPEEEYEETLCKVKALKLVLKSMS